MEIPSQSAIANTIQLTNKEIVEALFAPASQEGPNRHQCSLCKKNFSQTKRAGHNNLFRHALTHKDYHKQAQDIIEAKGKLKPTIEVYIEKRSSDTMVWLELIVQVLRGPVGATIRGMKFALVLDGFTEGAEHCLCVFAATTDGARFMSFTQFKKRGSQTADEHILCLDTILDEFGLDAVDLVCLVGDNMNTNRCISKRTTVPFVGCAAHRLNLGVKAFIQAKGHQDDLKRFSSFMRKLRTVSRWAKLEEAGCPCNPEVLHDIRWTGAFDMIERYMKMRPFLVKFESDVDVDDRVPGHLQYEYQDKSVQELIPSAANHARLRELHEDLRVFAYATRQLQEPRLTIADVRDLFDMLIVRHGSLKEQLGAEAKAVVSTMFEHVLVKLQNKKTLTRAEAPFAT
ncbi:hypothetical protein ON010_g15842 [Phytophthora cinnamomi]|nr:hypothetical protein ON010_g15842 [Phytophthora cinnamomi]